MRMIQEIISLNACLLQNLAERTFRHVTIVVGDGGIFTRTVIKPDFVTARSLSIERESVYSQHFSYFTISESR